MLHNPGVCTTPKIYSKSKIKINFCDYQPSNLLTCDSLKLFLFYVNVLFPQLELAQTNGQMEILTKCFLRVTFLGVNVENSGL